MPEVGDPHACRQKGLSITIDANEKERKGFYNQID